MSPRSCACLAVLLVSAFACASANRAGSASDPEYHEDFCDAGKEADAFTVMTVRIEVENAIDHSFRIPVARRRYAITRDSEGNYHVEGGCVGAFRGISADNPFSGSGFNGFVSLGVMSAKGGDLSITFSWTKADGTRGSTKDERPFSWGTPTRYQVEKGVVVSTTFEAPKKDG